MNVVLNGPLIIMWVQAGEHQAAGSRLAGRWLVLDHPNMFSPQIPSRQAALLGDGPSPWHQGRNAQECLFRVEGFVPRCRSRVGFSKLPNSPEIQDDRDLSQGFWQAGDVPATCMKG